MSKIQIRAWTSEDGWWLGSDQRLQFVRSFNKYGIIAKITYLYAKIFYSRVIVEVEDETK